MNFKMFLKNEQEKDYFKRLDKFIKEEYKNHICFPKYEDIYNAFLLTDFNNIKVVIIGQDPYINKDEAHGLAFSTLNKKLPKSLMNIYKEMSSDLNTKINQDGNLDYLAKQGVLLLNTILTVRQGISLSHKGKGWEEFTFNVIKHINKSDKPIIFILWGNNAMDYENYLTNENHLIIKSSHPSPLGAYKSFFGSKPFSKTNDFLESKNLEIIKWYK